MVKISMQYFGGRGGSSGASKGGNSGPKYISEDKTLIQGESITTARYTGANSTGHVVLQAKTDNKGNITLGYASADDYIKESSRHTLAVTELKNGITSMDDRGKFVGLRSVGIDWKNVKSVGGQTYGTQSLMRENGFKWNGSLKKWTK